MMQLVRIFGSAVLGQAFLSAANLIAAILLVRYAADTQYGFYVLIMAGLMLLASLQSAFIAPQLVDRLSRLDPGAHGALTGGVFQTQQRFVYVLATGVLALTTILWLSGRISGELAVLSVATTLAAATYLRRSFLRTLLLAYHRAVETLRPDALFGTVLVAGILLAVSVPHSAAVAIAGLGLAALVGSQLLMRTLQRNEPMDLSVSAASMYSWIPIGAWSVGGAAVHWSFSQGYNYLVAGLMDVSSVAAIAAVRLLVMPVILISAGIGPLMMPLASKWLHKRGPRYAWHRLQLAAAGVATAALLYLLLAWNMQDWIFASLFNKDYPQRELMLGLWSSALLLLVMRDQLIYLLIASQRFRALMMLACLSAIVSLSTGYLAMQYIGPAGAVLGVLIGEIVSLGGVLILASRECAAPDTSSTSLEVAA